MSTQIEPDHKPEEELRRVFPRQPFWTLRAFVDAVYGVVLAYGITNLALTLNGLRTYLQAPDISGPLPWTAIYTGLMILPILVMLTDDYARSRIINSMAPCRVVERFSLDVVVGACFCLSLHFAAVPSRAFLFFLGAAFVARFNWTWLVSTDSKAWKMEMEIREKIQGKELDNGKSIGLDAAHIWLLEAITDKLSSINHSLPSVRHWDSYQNRLSYLTVGSILMGGVLWLLFALSFFLDPEKTFFPLIGILLSLMYMALETDRYYRECKVILLAERETKVKGYGKIKTVFWIPQTVKGWLETGAAASLKK